MSPNPARANVQTYRGARRKSFTRLCLLVTLLGIFLLLIQSEAAQFEGSSPKLPVQPTPSTVVEANQSSLIQQNATTIDQTPIAKVTAKC